VVLLNSILLLVIGRLSRFIVGELMKFVMNMLFGWLYIWCGVLICCRMLFFSIVMWLFIVMVLIWLWVM